MDDLFVVNIIIKKNDDFDLLILECMYKVCWQAHSSNYFLVESK